MGPEGSPQDSGMTALGTRDQPVRRDHIAARERAATVALSAPLRDERTAATRKISAVQSVVRKTCREFAYIEIIARRQTRITESQPSLARHLAQPSAQFTPVAEFTTDVDPVLGGTQPILGHPHVILQERHIAHLEPRLRRDEPVGPGADRLVELGGDPRLRTELEIPDPLRRQRADIGQHDARRSVVVRIAAEVVLEA